MGDSFFNGDLLFYIGPIFIGIIFIIVISFIVFSIVASIRQWRKNNNSPRLSVPAIISSKRVEVRGGSHGPDHISHSTTDYYATFEFESKDRLEFEINGKVYGMLAEGDIGVVTFQGTRFISFSRENVNLSKQN
ncbi:MAG: DUF2500 domain-containing protein [Bacillota bacterium]|nr:DUF2500 domain-containing protein [Bacillota bacterium]